MSATQKLTAREASERTGRAISTIHSAARRKELPCSYEMRNGMQCRIFDAAAINEWNEKRKFRRKFVDRAKFLAAIRRRQDFFGLSDGEVAKFVGFETSHWRRILRHLEEGKLSFTPDVFAAILLWLEVDLKELQP